MYACRIVRTFSKSHFPLGNQLFRSMYMRKLRLEPLEDRRQMASLSGQVVIDSNSDFQNSQSDTPVSGTFVWLDSDNDGQFDPSEPSKLTDVSGKYLFENLLPGTYAVRCKPTIGLLQSVPAVQFGMAYNAPNGLHGVGKIDVANGTVTQLLPASSRVHYGLIKTVVGDYFAADFTDDTLYRIDGVTGQESAIGKLGKEVVGGLAYDPVMDEIYTLARDTDAGNTVLPLRLFKIDRLTAKMTQVSNVVPSIDGIRFTSGMAMNWVSRELVLFDNGSDTFFAYDLLGSVRKLGTFAGPTDFYNLSFDGRDFVTFFYRNDQLVVATIDPVSATLTHTTTFNPAPGQSSMNTNASDIASANEPNLVSIFSTSDVVTGVDFLTLAYELPNGSFNISGDQVQLVSIPGQVEKTYSLNHMGPIINFCIGATSTDLDVVITESENPPVSLHLGKLNDSVTLHQSPIFPIDLGGGFDTLFLNENISFDLTANAKFLKGVDVVNLSGASRGSLSLNDASIHQVSDADNLLVKQAKEDFIDLTLSPWKLQPPVVHNGVRVHQLATDIALLQLENELPWQNPLMKLDVDSDGSITPLDVLLIINLLNESDTWRLDASNPRHAAAGYVDVDGDGNLSPLDVLMVINELNKGNK